jgi:predicted nucleic acid-binding protein
VVDTNVIGYLFLSSERSLMAERILHKDPEWVAPLLWRSEFRNVLAFYMRKELIGLEEAQRIMDAALDLLRGREYEVPSHEVLRIASTSGCSAYDCEFVAIAIDLKVPFVTADLKLVREFPAVSVSVDSFGK